MKIHIRNMVCERRIVAVRKIFAEAGHHPVSVLLGEVDTSINIVREDLMNIGEKLREQRFEIIDDSKSRIIEKIKNLIMDYIQYVTAIGEFSLSSVIKSRLNRDYNYISNLFSSMEGITIKKYFIIHKIEKVKELLVYNELNISEIAFKLGYSRVAHLLSQF